MIRTRRSPVSGHGGEKSANEWEMRPGGMLVQKRSPDSESAVAAVAAPVLTIRVKVKYESVYYEIYVNPQSSFGELKKLMAERTGVHHQEMKIMYKDKERDSSLYLDVCGVKDKSKLVMEVDPTARAKRLLEMRKAAKLEKAVKDVKEVSAEVDKIALQVSELDKSISKGKKVEDKNISNLIELLMMQLIILDGIVADRDLKLQRGMQVRRVQKYVETLDVLKIKNAKIVTHQHQKKQQLAPASVIVTQEWETFDSLFGPSSSNSTSTSTSTTTSNSNSNSTASSTAAAPKLDWELF